MNDSFDPSRRRRAEHDRADTAARLQSGCHLVVLAAPDPGYLAYRPGVPLVAGVWKDGRPI